MMKSVGAFAAFALMLAAPTPAFASAVEPEPIGATELSEVRGTVVKVTPNMVYVLTRSGTVVPLLHNQKTMFLGRLANWTYLMSGMKIIAWTTVENVTFNQANSIELDPHPTY